MKASASLSPKGSGEGESLGGEGLGGESLGGEGWGGMDMQQEEKCASGKLVAGFWE